MPSRAARKSKTLATRTAEHVFAVPKVVAHRVARMAIAGPAPPARDRKAVADARRLARTRLRRARPRARARMSY